MKENIVFISASSGGGHNSAAHALKTLINERYTDRYTFQIIDIYKDSFFSKLPLVAKIRYHSDFIWGKFIFVSNNKFMVKVFSWMMKPSMLRALNKQMPPHCSHLIAVHFNPAQCLKQLAQNFNTPPKTSIVVTDFDPHWAWLGKGADSIFIASEMGRKKALSQGYDDKKITPLTVIPTQSIAYKRAINTENSALKFILVSGQDGSNSQQIMTIINTLDSMATAEGVQLDVYCGTNHGLKRKLELEFRACRHIDLRVHGYTENLKSRFHQADLAIIRTSPGILSECISASVPVLGFEWSAHERYQPDFIHDKKIGLASKNKKEIKHFLESILLDRTTLIALHRNINVLRNSIDNNYLLDQLMSTEREPC
jgi:processive 1,2-diacylglycerol beta-glucosyltransferase